MTFTHMQNSQNKLRQAAQTLQTLAERGDADKALALLSAPLSRIASVLEKLEIADLRPDREAGSARAYAVVDDYDNQWTYTRLSKVADKLKISVNTLKVYLSRDGGRTLIKRRDEDGNPLYYRVRRLKGDEAKEALGEEV